MQIYKKKFTITLNILKNNKMQTLFLLVNLFLHIIVDKMSLLWLWVGSIVRGINAGPLIHAIIGGHENWIIGALALTGSLAIGPPNKWADRRLTSLLCRFMKCTFGLLMKTHPSTSLHCPRPCISPFSMLAGSAGGASDSRLIRVSERESERTRSLTFSHLTRRSCYLIFTRPLIWRVASLQHAARYAAARLSARICIYSQSTLTAATLFRQLAFW